MKQQFASSGSASSKQPGMPAVRGLARDGESSAWQGEQPANILTRSLEQIEKLNTNYIKDLTGEYYILEQEFEEHKATSDRQLRSAGSTL